MVMNGDVCWLICMVMYGDVWWLVCNGVDENALYSNYTKVLPRKEFSVKGSVKIGISTTIIVQFQYLSCSQYLFRNFSLSRVLYYLTSVTNNRCFNSTINYKLWKYFKTILLLLNPTSDKNNWIDMKNLCDPILSTFSIWK